MEAQSCRLGRAGQVGPIYGSLRGRPQPLQHQRSALVYRAFRPQVVPQSRYRHTVSRSIAALQEGLGAAPDRVAGQNAAPGAPGTGEVRGPGRLIAQAGFTNSVMW